MPRRKLSSMSSIVTIGRTTTKRFVPSLWNRYRVRLTMGSGMPMYVIQSPLMVRHQKVGERLRARTVRRHPDRHLRPARPLALIPPAAYTLLGVGENLLRSARENFWGSPKSQRNVPTSLVALHSDFDWLTWIRRGHS
jgi:hypothetical protein